MPRWFLVRAEVCRAGTKRAELYGVRAADESTARALVARRLMGQRVEGFELRGTEPLRWGLTSALHALIDGEG